MADESFIISNAPSYHLCKDCRYIEYQHPSMTQEYGFCPDQTICFTHPLSCGILISLAEGELGGKEVYQCKTTNSECVFARRTIYQKILLEREDWRPGGEQPSQPPQIPAVLEDVGNNSIEGECNRITTLNSIVPSHPKPAPEPTPELNLEATCSIQDTENNYLFSK